MRYGVRTVRLTGKTVRIIAVVLVAIGVAMAVLAIVVNSITSRSWAERTETVTGMIVDARVTSSSRISTGRDRAPLYCPIVEYSVAGTQYSLESQHCSSGRPELGEEITVRYNPADPGDSVIESWASRWLSIVMLSGFGAGFMVAGGMAYFLARTMPRASDGPPRYGPAPGYGTPSFPPALPGAVGLERGAVDMLAARVEQAYQALATGQRPPLTSLELSQTQLMPVPGQGVGYDRQIVEAYLASARSFLQQAESRYR